MRTRITALLACLISASALAQEATWRAQTSGTTENLTGVSFGSATTGLAVGNAGTILRTTDGGVTWSRVSGISGLDPTRCCSDVSFFNATTVWLAGSGTVLRSGSSGSGWFGFTYATHTRRAVSATAGDTAFFVGTHSAGGRYVSRHMFVGNNSSLSSWSSGSENLYDVDFVSADEGWIVGSSGRIVHVTAGTSDSPTFTNQSTGTTRTLRGIDMIDRNNGWAAGDAGTILRTTNGGATWTAQHSGTVNDLRSISFATVSEGFAVGTGGLILATTDGGTTWKSETSGVSVDVASVFHGPIAVAVGANGTIVKRSTAPGGCEYSVNPLFRIHFSSAGSANFTLNTFAGCPWTAGSQAAWLTITGPATGNGPGTVSFAVAANTGPARDGTISVGSVTHTVTQYGPDNTCPFALSAPAPSFARGGGSGTVHVATLTACFWSLQASVPWITIEDSGIGELGSRTATYRVAENTTGAERTGTISMFANPTVPAITIRQTASAPARRRAVAPRR